MIFTNISNPNNFQLQRRKERIMNFADMTKEQHREISRKGAARSIEVRRARKNLKEALLDILVKPTKNVSNLDILDDLGLPKDIQSSMLVGLLRRAEKGDTKAIELTARLIGEYVEQTELNSSIKIEDFFKDHELKP